MLSSHSSPLGFPQKRAALGVAAIVIMLSASSILTWNLGQQIRDAIAAEVAVVTAVQRVGHYGTVLELSIKAVVANGDVEAAERYRKVQPMLRRTLHGLHSELQSTGSSSHAKIVDDADHALTRMEYQALELVGRNQMAEARRLIHSQRYDRLVAIYFEGVAQMEKRALAFIQRTDAKIDRYLAATFALSIASFAVLLVVWMTVLRPARQWGRALEVARSATEVANQRLTAAQLELQQANARLFLQARVDPLTGLFTRRRFNEDIEEVWLDAAQEGAIVLVMCDIDHFKQYNDLYGHPAGDEALRSVARALTYTARGGDRIYRYGGEEFLLLIETNSANSAAICVDRFRAAVEALGIPHRGSSLGHLSVSMGLSQMDRRRHSNIDRWIKQADAALYHAKGTGRNRVALEQDKAA